MSTGQTWLNLEATSILGLADLTDRLSDPIRDAHALLVADVYGGDGVIGATRAALTYGSSLLTLGASVVGVTGEGKRLALNSAAGEWASVPFANSGATVYYVGARPNEYPAGVSGNTTDGLPVYTGWVEAIGELGTPNSVTDNGDGTITLRIDTLVAPGWTVASTRPVKVWLNDPETASADAIYTGTAAYHSGSGQIRVTVPHVFGQSAVSTTAADYAVMVLGPTISTSDLSADDAYLFLGTVTSGVFDDSAQTLMYPWGTWVTAFEVEHYATGLHSTINADLVRVAGTTGAKVRTTAVSAPDGVSNPALQVRDSTPNALIELYANLGGIVKFPRADLGGGSAGAYIDAQDSSGVATRVNLMLTNRRLSTNYADLWVDGRIHWNPTKSANNWRLSCDLAAHQTLVLTNLNATYRASLNLTYGNIDLDNGQIICDGQGVILGGANPVYAWASAQTRNPKIPVWTWHYANSGTPSVFMGSGATPPYVESSSTSDLVISVPLNPYLGLDPEDAGLVLNALQLWYYRASSTGSITYELKSTDDTTTPSAVTTHYTWTATATTGWSQAVTPAATSLGLTLDTDKIYWVEITLSPTGGGTATDYRAHALNLAIAQTYAI